MQIGLFEDQRDQAEALALLLRHAGFGVLHAESALSFWKQNLVERCAALILDWQLPDVSGVDLVRSIRAGVNPNIPILMLTVRDRDEDAIQALEAGADDFIVKPVRSAILIARVRTTMRARGVLRPLTVDTSPYRIDGDAHQVYIHQTPIPLTAREYLLAQTLFQRVGRVVSRDDLLREVWGLDRRIVTRRLDTHVSRLRQKLMLTGAHGWRLDAVYRHGYRLVRVAAGMTEAEAEPLAETG